VVQISFGSAFYDFCKESIAILSAGEQEVDRYKNIFKVEATFCLKSQSRQKLLPMPHKTAFLCRNT
jgi:hypothetical protein